MKRHLVVFLMGLLPWFAQAADIHWQKVKGPVYAYVGPTDDRTEENLGLNANYGAVVTSKGVVLIDSGPSVASARALEASIRKQLHKPVIAVLNTGSQDHRWLGNGYFAEKGIQVYALSSTVATQKKMTDQLVAQIRSRGKVFQEQKVFTAPKPLPAPEGKVVIDGETFVLRTFGDAHFPGDATIWVANHKVLFSGDMIYVDRMLGIHPWSKVLTWQPAFHKAEKAYAYAAAVVPGHGRVSDWKRCRQDTGNYLDKLVKTAKQAIDDMVELEDYIEANRNWPEFKHLKHYDSWHPKNLSRTYTQVEAASF